MYEIIMATLGVIGTIFGLYSLILQFINSRRIDPRIQSTFVRIAPNLDYLIQVNIINLGNRVAENCTARIFEDENPLADLSHMPIDSPLGRISPDWPTYSFFTIFPKTIIIVRGYLDSKLQGRRVQIRLYHNDNVRDRSNEFTLPHPREFSAGARAVELPADIVVEPTADIDEAGKSFERSASAGLEMKANALLMKRIDLPEPSFPSDRWEFLWFRYTEDNKNPWGELIAQTSKIELNFDDDWGKGIVNNSGLSNNVAFKASRTLPLDAGRYTFLIGADDGIRLYVRNNDLTETYVEMDEWRDQEWSKFENPVPVDLPAGDYKILIEWYEHYVHARVKFKIDKLVKWNLSGAVMSGDYGRIDIPDSDSASRLKVHQLEGEVKVKIVCDMRGLKPISRYKLDVCKEYVLNSPHWPGRFSDTISIISFTTDSEGCGKKEFNLRFNDFSNRPGVHTLSVFLNDSVDGRTILISDNFVVNVRS